MKKMKIETKKAMCVAVAWMAFIVMLGIVGGTECGWMELKFMWWTIPCLLVWAGGLYKAGWIRV